MRPDLTGMRPAFIAVALALSASTGSGSAWAQAQNEQHRDENGQQDAGVVKIAVNYASDLNADIAGGESRGADYLGRISLLLDADLDKLIGLTGGNAHLSVYQIHGTGLSGHRVGNLLTVSGLEAEPAIRLNQLWLEFAPAADAKLRIGKFTAAQDFMNSATANLFVNSTFGWPGSFATDLPSGGPAYPLSAPGVRLAIKPEDGRIMQVAIFAGDPAGPGSGDPQRRERHGFNTFGFAGKPFVISEIGRDVGGKTPTFSWRLGGWLHFNRFANLGRAPAIATNPVGPATDAARRRGNAGVYGFIDGQVWKSPGDMQRTARVFVRASYSPPDRNVIDLYLDAGASLAAPLKGREGDMLGIAIGVARISPRLRSTARTLARSGDPATVPPPFELVGELSYSAAIGSKLKLQPNVQVIVNPAGSALAIQTRAGRIPDAVVIGLRSSVSF